MQGCKAAGQKAAKIVACRSGFSLTKYLTIGKLFGKKLVFMLQYSYKNRQLGGKHG